MPTLLLRLGRLEDWKYLFSWNRIIPVKLVMIVFQEKIVAFQEGLILVSEFLFQESNAMQLEYKTSW